MSKKPPVLAVAVLGALVLAAPSAWAHAEFDQKSARANSDVGFVLRVPEERGPDLHNEKVVLVVPDGWAARKCDSKASWGCSMSPPSADRPGLVTWNRQSPGGDDVFRLTLRTGGPGRIPVNVHQTYSDGMTVHWDGPEDSETPAPVVEVH